VINILVVVHDPEGAMSLYDTVHIYSDMDQYGAFTNLVTEIELQENTTEYTYTHDVSTETWYEISYFDTTDSTESLRTGPVEGLLQGGPDVFTRGPLGILTIAYVKDMTTFNAIGILKDSQIAELIIRAETMLANFAANYGGWNTGYPNYQILLQILARLMLEEIWLRSSQTLRAASAGGFIAETMGAYSYRRGWPLDKAAGSYPASMMAYYTPEMQKLLFDLVNTSPTQVYFSTTQTFRELVAKQNADGQYIRPDWDGWNKEIYWAQQVYEYMAAPSLDKPTYLLAPAIGGRVQG
jgi:hypothetical protein